MNNAHRTIGTHGEVRRFDKRSGRASMWWLIVVLAGSLWPAAAFAQPLEEIQGTYVYVGGQVQRDRAHQAVETIVDQMGAISRAFARNKLHAACAVPGRIVFTPQGDNLAITLSPQPARTSQLDGTSVSFQNTEGQTVAMQRVVRGEDTIIETIDAARDSRRVITYRFSPDRSRLTIRWRLENPRYLPAPITYTLSFRRQ